MAVTQYIGARYVPQLADPMEWSSAKSYEPLTIVLYEGNSYTSKQFVPIGVDITNETFWAPTGNYNAQVEIYRQETQRYTQAVDAINDALPINDFDAEHTVSSYILRNKRYEGMFFVSDFQTDGVSDDDAFDACLAAADEYIGMPTVVIDKTLHIYRSHGIKPQNYRYSDAQYIGKRIVASFPASYTSPARMLRYPDHCWTFIVEADNVTVLGINHNPENDTAYNTNCDANFIVEDITILNNGGFEDSTKYIFNYKNVNGVVYNRCSVEIEHLHTLGCNRTAYAYPKGDETKGNYLDFCTLRHIHCSYAQGMAIRSQHNDCGIYEDITVGYPSREYFGHLIELRLDSGSFVNGVFIKFGTENETEFVGSDAAIALIGCSTTIAGVAYENKWHPYLIHASNSLVNVLDVTGKFDMFPVIRASDSSYVCLKQYAVRAIKQTSGTSLVRADDNTCYIEMNNPIKTAFYGEEVPLLPIYTYAGNNSIYNVTRKVTYTLIVTDSTINLRSPYAAGSSVTHFEEQTYTPKAGTTKARIKLSNYIPQNIKIFNVDVVPQGAAQGIYRTGMLDNNKSVYIDFDDDLTSTTMYYTLTIEVGFK